jgi:histidine ammonia-lyase
VIRQTIDHLETDRILAEDIVRMRTLMKSGKLLDAVEAAVGKLA